MKITKREIIEKAENLGWNVSFDINGAKGDKYAEFRQYSPAGEDFGFTVFYDTISEVPQMVAQYAYDFDIDEHIEMWVEAKQEGVAGVPSIRRLVEDAEDIQEMLDKLSYELNKR